MQRAAGEDVDAIFVIAVYREIVHIGEVQLLGRHIALAPAPEGPVAEPGIIRRIITAEILYILHLRRRSRIGDADHQLGGQIGAHKGGAEGGGTVLVLDELSVGTHLADVRVGGLPCDIPLGGGGRGDGQLQVVIRLLHGGDVDALLKGDALRRLHHSDGDGGGEVLAHGGAGGDDGGTHGHGVYGAVDVHGGYVLIGALVDHTGAGGILRGEHGRQLLGAAHRQAEGILVEGQALQRHAVGHMDGHVLIHGAIGVADAHQGATGGHGGDEAGVADGDNALIQRGIAQVGHQRRFHGRHLRQQLLCHAGVEGDLGFGQGDVGDGGVGEFQQEVVVGLTAITRVELIIIGAVPVISAAIEIRPPPLGNIRPKGHIRRVTVQPAQCAVFILPQSAKIAELVKIYRFSIVIGTTRVIFQIRPQKSLLFGRLHTAQLAAQILRKTIHQLRHVRLRPLESRIRCVGRRVGQYLAHHRLANIRRCVAADTAAVFVQVVVVSVKDAVGVFVRIVQANGAVHKDAAVAGCGDRKRVIRPCAAQLIESAVLQRIGGYESRIVARIHHAAAERAVIDRVCPVILAEFAVLGVGDTIISIFRAQVRIYHIGIVQLDGALVALVELHTVLGHQLAGEHADVLVLAAIAQQGAVHLEIGDGGVGVGVVGIVRPELELGARLHGDGDALLNEGGVGQDVIVILGEGHVLGDNAGQNGAPADVNGGLGFAGIDLCIVRVQIVFRGDGDVQGDDVVVGAVVGDLHQQGLIGVHAGDERALLRLTVVDAGVGAHIAVVDVIGQELNVRAVDARLTFGIQREGDVLGGAPAVAEGEGQRHRLAGVDDTVAVILVAEGLVVKDEEVGGADLRLRQLGQSVVDIHDLGQVVDAVALRGAADGIAAAGGGDLPVDELGGIGVGVRVGAAQEGGHGGHVGGGHGGAAPCGVAVAGDGAEDLAARGVDLILHGVIFLHVIVSEAALHAPYVHAHDAHDVGQGGGVGGTGKQALVGRTVVAGSGHQHAAGVGRLQRVLHGDGGGAAAEGHVDDVRAVVVGVEDALGDLGLVEEAAGHARLDGHELHVVGQTHHADVVVGGGDDAGHVGAVAVVVHAAVASRLQIHAVDVVDVAVAVVVDAVAGDLLGVDPDVVLEILVGVVHAGVDDGHYHAAVAAGGDAAGAQEIPALLQVAAAQVPLILAAGVALHGLGHGVAVDEGGVGGGVHVVVLRQHHVVQRADVGHDLLHVAGDGGDVPDAGGGVHELFKAGDAGADKGGVQLAAEAAGKLDHDLVAGVETVVAGEFLREGQIVGDGQGIVLVQRSRAAGGGLRRVRFDVAGDGQLRAGQTDGRRVLVGDALTAGGGVGVGGGRRIGDGGRFRAGEDVRSRQQAGEFHCRGQHDH